MKKSVKLLSVFLAILLTAVSLPLSAFATENPVLPYEEEKEESSIRVKEDVFELTEKRGETSKQIHLADGSIMLVEYAVPVHRLDANGEWQDIDNRLSLVGNEYRTDDARLKFAQRITGNDPLYTLQDGEYQLTVTLEGASGKTEGEAAGREEESASMTKAEKITTLSKLSSEITYQIFWKASTCSIRSFPITLRRISSSARKAAGISIPSF